MAIFTKVFHWGHQHRSNYPFDFNNALTSSVREDLEENVFTQISQSGLNQVQAPLIGLGAIYWLRKILSRKICRF